MQTTTIPVGRVPALVHHWPGYSNEPIGGDYLVGDAGDGMADVVWQHDTDPPWTYEAVEAYVNGPEWLAYRKRELKVGLVGAVTAPVAAAWASVPEMIRLHNPQLLSTAYQTRHAADMTAMAGALSAAQQAIDAAQTVADAEAAAAAVTVPTPAGPED